MPNRRLKIGYFVLEGLNSFATVYYFYYLYFFMQKAFGFGNKANLALAAPVVEAPASTPGPSETISSSRADSGSLHAQPAP